MQNYGKRLKSARQAKGYTQIELAERLKISQTSYQRMETGNHDMKMSNIINICKTLDISADWLIGLTDNMIPLSADCHKELHKKADNKQ